MTAELEQEFFRCFGIEHKCKRGKIVCAGRASNKCPTCQNNIYPEITDRKLLKLICTLNKEAIYGYSDWGGNFVIGETVEELKESILKDCIRDNSKVFKQIQQLFKEEE